MNDPESIDGWCTAKYSCFKSKVFNLWTLKRHRPHARTHTRLPPGVITGVGTEAFCTVRGASAAGAAAGPGRPEALWNGEKLTAAPADRWGQTEQNVTRFYVSFQTKKQQKLWLDVSPWTNKQQISKKKVGETIWKVLNLARNSQNWRRRFTKNSLVERVKVTTQFMDEIKSSQQLNKYKWSLRCLQTHCVCVWKVAMGYRESQ